MSDWTPEQIAAAAEAVHLARWEGEGLGVPDKVDHRIALAVLSAVDLSDHDRAVARAAQPRPDHDYCAWCGWSRERDDSDVDHLRAHVMECPKHPLRFGSSKRDAAIAARALRQAADVPCRFCHTPASTHDVTSCPRHFYHPEWMLAEGSSDE